MTQYESVRTPQDYVNYTFNISSKGVTQVAGELAGLSSTVSTILGDIAFKTSEFLSHTETMAIGAGAAVSAVFVKATQDAIRFEQQVANVKAIGGESVNAALIGDKAMEYSNKFGMAVSDMTEGLEALARAGITTTSVMTQVLEEGVKLSKLEGISLEDSINHLISTTNLLSQDNVDMNAPEYAQMLKDMNQHIVSTSESAPINAENIMQTLQHVGGYASASGMDQDDLFAVIAQLGARGTKGEMAGTALRAFIAAGNKDTAQRALARVGLSVSDLWDENGETMLSISEMKNVLDSALEARGYSKQEKLEFYSDFVGYKQANQVMKIDTTEVEKYKDNIANAWDLGTKLNTILGTVRGNLDRIWQISQNFMTKVGSKLLPVINAMLVPIRIGLELFTKIPFMDSLGAGLALFVGFRTVLLVINNIIPALGGLFSSMRTQKQYSKGIRGEWEKTRDAVKDAYKVVSNWNNKDKLAKIHRQRRGPSAEDKAHMEDTIFEAMYYESKYYQELKIPWKELEPGLQHAIGREFLGTPQFEENWKRMQERNEAIAGNIGDEAKVLDFGEYDPEGELSTINRYVQYIYSIIKETNSPQSKLEQNKQQHISGGSTRQESSRQPYTGESPKVEVVIDGRNTSKSAFQFEDINRLKSSIDVSKYGDYEHIYRNNVQQLIKDYNQAINDLVRKTNSFSNTRKEHMDKVQMRRYEKSLRREAMSEEGIQFASRANDSDIRYYLRTGVYREPKDKMLGIRDDQIKAMAKKVGLDFSDINNITGPDKREEQLAKIRQELKKKNISIDDVAEEANKVWVESQQAKRRVTYVPTQLLRDNEDMTLQLAGMFTQPTDDINQAVKQVQSFFANETDEATIASATRAMMGHLKLHGQTFSQIEEEEIKYILENIVRLENTASKLNIGLEDSMRVFSETADYNHANKQLVNFWSNSGIVDDLLDAVDAGVIQLQDTTLDLIANQYKNWIGTVTPMPLNASTKYTVNDSLYNRIIHNKEFKEDDLNIIIQDLLNGEDRYYNEAKSRITKRALSIHSPSTKQYHNVTQYKDDNGHVVYVEHGKSGDFITTKQKFATQKGFVDDYHLKELGWDMDKGVASRAFLPDYFEDAHRIAPHINGWKKNIARSLYLEKNIRPLNDEKIIKLIEERLGVNIERGDNASKQVQSSLNNAGNQTKLLEQYGLYYDKKSKRVIDILNPEAFQEGIFKGLISRNQVNRWRKQGFIGYDKYQIDDTFDLLESSGGKNIQYYYVDEEKLINESIMDIMSDFAMYKYQIGENIVNIQDIISHTQSQIKDILRYTDDELEEMLKNNNLYKGYITKEGFNVGHFNDIFEWGLDQKRRYSANDLAKMDYKNLQVSPYVLSAFGLNGKYDYTNENDVQQLLNDINEGKIFDKNMPIFTATKNVKKRKKTVTFKKKDLKLKYGHIDSEWAKTSEEYQNMKNKLYAYFDEEQKDLDFHVFEPVEVMKYVNENFKHIEKSARKLMAVDIIRRHSDFKDRDDSQLEQYIYNKKGKKFDVLTPFEIEKNNWKDWDKYMKGGNIYLSAAELRSLDWAGIFAPEWLEPLSMDAQWEHFGKEYLKNLYPDLEYENIAEEMAITFAEDKLLKDKKIFAISKKKFLDYYQHGEITKDADIDMFGVGEFRGTGYIADILRTAQLAIDEFNDQIDTVNLLEAMDRDYRDRDKDIPQITFIDTREEIINQIENSQNKVSDAVKTTIEDVQKTEEAKITKIKSRKHLGNFTIGTKPVKTTYDEKDILPSIMMIAMAKEYDKFMNLIEGDLIDDEDVANLSNKDISALYNIVYAEMSKIKDVKKARTKKDKMNEIRSFMEYGFMNYDTWEGYSRDEGKDFINNAVLNFFAEKFGTTRKVTSNLPKTRYTYFHVQDEKQLKAIQEYNKKRNEAIPDYYTRYDFDDLKVGDRLDYDSERMLSSLILASILYPHANTNDILQQQSKANLSLAPLFEDFLRTGNKEIFKYEFGEAIIDSIFRDMQMNDSLMQSMSWTTKSKRRAKNLRDALPHEDSKVYDFTIDLLVKAFTDKINGISEGYGGLWGDEYQHEGHMETLDENNEAIWRLDGHILEVGNNIRMAKTMIEDITNLAHGDARAALYAESRNMGRFGGNFFDNNLPDKVIIAMVEALGLKATGNRFQDIIAIADFMDNQGADEIEKGTYINPDKIAAIGVNKYLEEMQPVLTMDTFDDYYEAMRQVNSMISFGKWADIYGRTTVGIQAMADAVPNVPKYNDYEYETDKIAAFLEDNPTFKETFRRIGIDAINREYGYYTGVETAPFNISNGAIDVNLVDESVSPIETIKETVKEIRDNVKKDKEVQELVDNIKAENEPIKIKTDNDFLTLDDFGVSGDTAERKRTDKKMADNTTQSSLDDTTIDNEEEISVQTLPVVSLMDATVTTDEEERTDRQVIDNEPVVIEIDETDYWGDKKERADAFWAEQEKLEQEGIKEHAVKTAANMFNQLDAEIEKQRQEKQKERLENAQKIRDDIEKTNKTWHESELTLYSIAGTLSGVAESVRKLGKLFKPLQILSIPIEKASEKVQDVADVFDMIQHSIGVVKIFNSDMTKDEAEAVGLEDEWRSAAKLKRIFGEDTFMGALLEGMGINITEIFDFGKILMKAIGAQLRAFIIANIGILGPIFAGVAIAVGALWLSEQNHAKALKEATEEQEKARKEASASYITYKNLHEARKNEHDAMKRQQLARKESIALYKLETDRIRQLNAIEEKQKLKNDVLWGEYGARANFQKMGWLESIFAGGTPFVGTIAKWMSGDFESQYENYEGSTGEIRRIKETTLGSWGATSSQNAVSAWYDAHSRQLSQIEAFAPQLQELYDLESRLIDRYGSKEAARNSEEFNKAVQEFADATGLNKETAEKYLNYLQTEANVENARYAMQAEVNIITSKAQAEAYKALYGDETGIGELDSVQDAMVYATADQIFKDAYQELWWSMLMEWLAAIWNQLTLNFGEAQKHAKAAGAYQNGMRELAENQGRITQEGVDIAKEDQRKDYGNGSYTSSYGDTPFGGAEASSAAQEQDYAEEEMNKQDMYYNASKANGEAATQGFRDGLDQHSPGKIARSMRAEMIFSKEAIERGGESVMGAAYNVSDATASAFNWMGNNANDALNGVYDATSDVFNIVSDGAEWVGGTIFNALTGGGKSIFKGFSESIKKPSNIKVDNSKTEVHIHTVNINTDDDPEKIKTALMELIVEFGDLVTPKQVSRIIGTPPTTSTSSTEDTATENENAENTENSNTNTNNTPTT